MATVTKTASGRYSSLAAHPKLPQAVSLLEFGHSKGFDPGELFGHSYLWYPAVKMFSIQADSWEHSPILEAPK